LNNKKIYCHSIQILQLACMCSTILILIDSYHVGFLERYNSLVSLYASFNSGNSFPRLSKRYQYNYKKYLNIVNNFELRRSFTKLRTSSHRLQIELGRYQGVPRHNRVWAQNVLQMLMKMNYILIWMLKLRWRPDVRSFVKLLLSSKLLTMLRYFSRPKLFLHILYI
jgi:hypothetical protein